MECEAVRMHAVVWISHPRSFWQEGLRIVLYQLYFFLIARSLGQHLSWSGMSSKIKFDPGDGGLCWQHGRYLI